MSRAKWEQFLIGLGVLVYLLEFPHGIHGDASVRYDALRGFLSSGHLAPMVYSYVHPIFSSPLILLGHLYKDAFWWVSRFNSFMALGMIAFMAGRVRQWPEWKPESTRLLILLLMGATMFPKHVTDYYAEVFSACFAFAAILLFQSGRSGWAVAALCLSVWNVVASIFGGAGLLLFFAVREKRWRFLAALPLLPLGHMVENYLKYGEFFPSAYLAMQGPVSMLPYASGPGFSYPLFFGILNVFLSFGRGLLFFVPGLLILFYPALWKGREKYKEVIWAGTIYLAGLVLVYGKYWAWHGGAFWGPRYFLFASILGAFALAALRQERKISLPWRLYWIFAVALSCWVGCQGVLFGTDFLEDCFSRGHEIEYTCYYVPEYSVLWRFFIVAPAITGRRVVYLAYFLLIATTVLWAPVKEGARECWSYTRRAWKDFGPFSGWRV